MNLLFLLGLVFVVKVQAVLFGNQLPSVFHDVINANGTARIGIAVGGVVDGAATEFWK
jgi:hypothetical protein